MCTNFWPPRCKTVAFRWGSNLPFDLFNNTGEGLAWRPSWGEYMMWWFGWVWVVGIFFGVFVCVLSVGDPSRPPSWGLFDPFFSQNKKRKKKSSNSKKSQHLVQNLFFSTYPFSLFLPAGNFYTCSFLSMGCADYAAHVKNKATTHVRYATQLHMCVCAWTGF